MNKDTLDISEGVLETSRLNFFKVLIELPMLKTVDG
jgi:hypothetical protein